MVNSSRPLLGVELRLPAFMWLEAAGLASQLRMCISCSSHRNSCRPTHLGVQIHASAGDCWLEEQHDSQLPLPSI